MRAFYTLLLTVFGFWAVEYAIFHTDAYYTILRHDSSTGSVETYVRNELKRGRTNPHQVLTIGDSRMGFLPRYANELAPGTGYQFASIALGGATPRDWYYMLRGADPQANKYSAVVIAMEDYEDSEIEEDLSVRAADLYYLIGRLQYVDLPYFAGSYRHDRALEWAAARGIVLKGLVYKRDFQEFLLHPVERVKLAEQARRDSFFWYYNYVGPNQSMEGVQVDFVNRTVTVPPGFTEAQKAAYTFRFLAPHPPDHGVHSEYLHQWLGKIYEHYHGSKTRMVFLHLPRGPFVRPDQPAVNPHSSVRELAQKPGVLLLPEHLFDLLERPSLFVDQMHLNGPGCAEFSRMLAREVARELDAL
ncbi:MAG TPA: hypothetical protein VMT15_12580 [Bryobacteraceae bacterium]|nr:hypothetical protein [Bryobacteraceae bacterium]